MTPFEVVVIVVGVVGIALAAIARWRSGRQSEQIGRSGGLWMDHIDELDREHRPMGDEREAPIPVRPVRGRPEPPDRSSPNAA